MTPVKIVGANVNYGAPKDWDAEKQGECHTLPVRVANIEGLGVCQSAWRPSREELDALISGHAIVLTIWGKQPVVGLHVERAAE